jgi:hypothetical protein
VPCLPHTCSLQVVHAAASLCHFPDAALDMLLMLADDVDDNDSAIQLASIVTKVMHSSVPRHARTCCCLPWPSLL